MLFVVDGKAELNAGAWTALLRFSSFPFGLGCGGGAGALPMLLLMEERREEEEGGATIVITTVAYG